MGQEEENARFCAAIQRTGPDDWQKMLAEKMNNPDFPLNTEQCLRDALLHGRQDAANAILTSFKVNPHMEMSRGQRLIHAATERGFTRTVELLLEEGACVNGTNVEGFSALHLACRRNRVEVAEALIRHNANTCATQMSTRLTPLHLAVMSENVEMAKLLLKHGASQNSATSTTKGGLTPLALAVKDGDLHMVLVLMSSVLPGRTLDFAIDSEGSSLLHLAVRAKRNGADILALLIENLGEMSIPHNALIIDPFYYSQPSSAEQVDRLKRMKVAKMLNVKDSRSHTALRVAIDTSNVEHAYRLLITCVEFGVNLTQDEYLNAAITRYWQSVLNNMTVNPAPAAEEAEEREEAWCDPVEKNLQALYAGSDSDVDDYPMQDAQPSQTADEAKEGAGMTGFNTTRAPTQTPKSSQQPEQGMDLSRYTAQDLSCIAADAIVRLLVEHKIFDRRGVDNILQLCLTNKLFTAALMLLTTAVQTNSFWLPFSARYTRPLVSVLMPETRCGYRDSSNKRHQLKVLEAILQQGLSPDIIMTESVVVREVSQWRNVDRGGSTSVGWQQRGPGEFPGRITLLNVAASMDNLDAVKLLIQYGADASDVLSHRTPQEVQSLIEAGADVNFVADDSAHRDTALHKAVKRLGGDENSSLYLERVKLLVRSGANMAARNERGLTPLQEVIYTMALTYKRDLIMNGMRVVQYLIEVGSPFLLPQIQVDAEEASSGSRSQTSQAGTARSRVHQHAAMVAADSFSLVSSYLTMPVDRQQQALGRAQILDASVAHALAEAIIELTRAGGCIKDEQGNVLSMMQPAQFLALAFKGLSRIVYYLASVGWPVWRESPVSIPMQVDGQRRMNLVDWILLPGKTEEQETLHAYLMLLRANPPSLQELARLSIRRFLSHTKHSPPTTASCIQPEASNPSSTHPGDDGNGTGKVELTSQTTGNSSTTAFSATVNTSYSAAGDMPAKGGTSAASSGAENTLTSSAVQNQSATSPDAHQTPSTYLRPWAVRSSNRDPHLVCCMEIESSVGKLPIPEPFKRFLLFRDRDYSDGDEAWSRLSHLLPKELEEKHAKAFPAPILEGR